MMKRLNKFAENLSEVINAKGLTQKTVANAIGVKPNTLNQWTTGKREPDFDHLLMLCYYLKMSPSELLSYRSNPNEQDDMLQKMLQIYMQYIATTNNQTKAD